MVSLLARLLHACCLTPAYPPRPAASPLPTHPALLPCTGAKPETRARSREVLYATSEALERAAAKRQRQQGQQPEQERRPPRKQHHAADEAQQQQQQQDGEQTPASGKKSKKRRQQEAAEAAEAAATPQQQRPQQQAQAPAAAETEQQVPPSSSKKQRKASRLGPPPAAAAQLQAASRRQRHEMAADAAVEEEERRPRQQGVRQDITEQEQQLLAAAVAAVTGGGTPGDSPSKQKKAVRFSLKRNLVNVIGQPPKPEDVRTPPTSKPKGPALKKHSAFGGPASAPERLLTRAGGCEEPTTVAWGGAAGVCSVPAAVDADCSWRTAVFVAEIHQAAHTAWPVASSPAGVERLAHFNSWQQQRQGDATPNSAPPAGAAANGLGSSKKKQKQRRNSLPAPGSFSRPRASEFF